MTMGSRFLAHHERLQRIVRVIDSDATVRGTKDPDGFVIEAPNRRPLQYPFNVIDDYEHDDQLEERIRLDCQLPARGRG